MSMTQCMIRHEKGNTFEAGHRFNSEINIS